MSKKKWIDLSSFGVSFTIAPATELRSALFRVQVVDDNLLNKIGLSSRNGSFHQAIVDIGFQPDINTYLAGQELLYFSPNINFSINELQKIFPITAENVSEFKTEDIYQPIMVSDQTKHQWRSLIHQLSKSQNVVWIVPKLKSGEKGLKAAAEQYFENPHQSFDQLAMVEPLPLAYLERLGYSEDLLTTFFTEKEFALAEGFKEAEIVQARLPFALPMFIQSNGMIIALNNIHNIPELLNYAPTDYPQWVANATIAQQLSHLSSSLRATIHEFELLKSAMTFDAKILHLNQIIRLLDFQNLSSNKENIEQLRSNGVSKEILSDFDRGTSIEVVHAAFQQFLSHGSHLSLLNDQLNAIETAKHFNKLRQLIENPIHEDLKEKGSAQQNVSIETEPVPHESDSQVKLIHPGNIPPALSQLLSKQFTEQTALEYNLAHCKHHELFFHSIPTQHHLIVTCIAEVESINHKQQLRNDQLRSSVLLSPGLEFLTGNDLDSLLAQKLSQLTTLNEHLQGLEIAASDLKKQKNKIIESEVALKYQVYHDFDEMSYINLIRYKEDFRKIYQHWLSTNAPLNSISIIESDKKTENHEIQSLDSSNIFLNHLYDGISTANVDFIKLLNSDQDLFSEIDSLKKQLWGYKEHLFKQRPSINAISPSSIERYPGFISSTTYEKFVNILTDSSVIVRSRSGSRKYDLSEGLRIASVSLGFPDNLIVNGDYGTLHPSHQSAKIYKNGRAVLPREIYLTHLNCIYGLIQLEQENADEYKDALVKIRNTCQEIDRAMLDPKNLALGFAVKVTSQNHTRTVGETNFIMVKPGRLDEYKVYPRNGYSGSNAETVKLNASNWADALQESFNHYKKNVFLLHNGFDLSQIQNLEIQALMLRSLDLETLQQSTKEVWGLDVSEKSLDSWFNKQSVELTKLYEGNPLLLLAANNDSPQPDSRNAFILTMIDVLAHLPIGQKLEKYSDFAPWFLSDYLIKEYTERFLPNEDQFNLPYTHANQFSFYQSVKEQHDQNKSIYLGGVENTHNILINLNPDSGHLYSRALSIPEAAYILHLAPTFKQRNTSWVMCNPSSELSSTVGQYENRQAFDNLLSSSSVEDESSRQYFRSLHALHDSINNRYPSIEAGFYPQKINVGDSFESYASFSVSRPYVASDLDRSESLPQLNQSLILEAIVGCNPNFLRHHLHYFRPSLSEDDLLKGTVAAYNLVVAPSTDNEFGQFHIVPSYQATSYKIIGCINDHIYHDFDDEELLNYDQYLKVLCLQAQKKSDLNVISELNKNLEIFSKLVKGIESLLTRELYEYNVLPLNCNPQLKIQAVKTLNNESYDNFISILESAKTFKEARQTVFEDLQRQLGKNNQYGSMTEVQWVDIIQRSSFGADQTKQLSISGTQAYSVWPKYTNFYSYADSFIEPVDPLKLIRSRSITWPKSLNTDGSLNNHLDKLDDILIKHLLREGQLQQLINQLQQQLLQVSTNLVTSVIEGDWSPLGYPKIPQRILSQYLDHIDESIGLGLLKALRLKTDMSLLCCPGKGDEHGRFLVILNNQETFLADELMSSGWQYLSEVNNALYSEKEIQKFNLDQNFPISFVAPNLQSIRASQIKTELENSESTGRIAEDTGERVYGARKDLYGDRLSLKDILGFNDFERSKLIKRDNIWPAPLYEHLVEKAGQTDIDVVIVSEVIRQSLPTKPRLPIHSSGEFLDSYNAYFNMVEGIRNVCELAKSKGELIKGLFNFYDQVLVDYDSKGRKADTTTYYGQMKYDLNRKNISHTLRGLRSEVKGQFLEIIKRSNAESDAELRSLYKRPYISTGDIKVDFDHSGFISIFSAMDDPDRSKVNPDFYVTVLRSGPTWNKFKALNSVLMKEKNIDLLTSSRLESTDEIWTWFSEKYKPKFKVPVHSTNHSVDTEQQNIGTLDIKAHPFLKPLIEHEELYDASRNAIRYGDVSHLINIERSGPKLYRAIDQDISAEYFQKIFGFRGVQFGKSLPQAERQQLLNMAFDCLCDLRDSLNIPLRALSMDGQLAIAFGARGRGGKNASLAHFEANKNIINLTRRAGAGCLAHEWFHALDHHLFNCLVERYSLNRAALVSSHTFMLTTMVANAETNNPKFKSDPLVQKTRELNRALRYGVDDQQQDPIARLSETIDRVASMVSDSRKMISNTQLMFKQIGSLGDLVNQSIEQYIVNRLEQRGRLSEFENRSKIIDKFTLGLCNGQSPYASELKSTSSQFALIYKYLMIPSDFLSKHVVNDVDKVAKSEMTPMNDKDHANLLTQYLLQNPRILNQLSRAHTSLFQGEFLLESFMKLKQHLVDRDINSDNSAMSQHIMSIASAYIKERDLVLQKDRHLQTNFYKSAMNLDALTPTRKIYWATALEMFARASECYITDKLKEISTTSNYLVMGMDDSKQLIAGVDSVAIHGIERKISNKKFDELMELVRQHIFLPEMETNMLVDHPMSNDLVKKFPQTVLEF